MFSVVVIVQLIWSFSLCVRGEGTVSSLTTAIPWGADVSMKPTTVYNKRIALDGYVVKRATDLPNIFDKMESEDRRRKSRADIWNWDYWCQFQAEKGNCSSKVKRYFYNSLLDQCDTFSYSGCGGNKNNFESLLDCERHCKGAAFMPLKDVERSISCSMQPNAGLCLALFDRYYYDVNAKNCKTFVYGGCGGNQNRFSSQHQCMTKCR